MGRITKNTECRKGSCRTLACDWHRFGGENEVCNSRNHFMRIRTQRDPGLVYTCSMGLREQYKEFLKRRFQLQESKIANVFPDCFLIDLQKESNQSDL